MCGRMQIALKHLVFFSNPHLSSALVYHPGRKNRDRLVLLRACKRRLRSGPAWCRSVHPKLTDSPEHDDGREDQGDRVLQVPCDVHRHRRHQAGHRKRKQPSTPPPPTREQKRKRLCQKRKHLCNYYHGRREGRAHFDSRYRSTGQARSAVRLKKKKREEQKTRCGPQPAAAAAAVERKGDKNHPPPQTRVAKQ